MWYNCRCRSSQVTKKGLTYETPVFNGLSAAYTMEFGSKSAKSYAVNYSTEYAGVNVKAAYGSFKQGLATSSDGYEQASPRSFLGCSIV